MAKPKIKDAYIIMIQALSLLGFLFIKILIKLQCMWFLVVMYDLIFSLAAWRELGQNQFIPYTADFGAGC